MCCLDGWFGWHTHTACTVTHNLSLSELFSIWSIYSVWRSLAKRWESSSCSWDTWVDCPTDACGPLGSSIFNSKLWNKTEPNQNNSNQYCSFFLYMNELSSFMIGVRKSFFFFMLWGYNLVYIYPASSATCCRSESTSPCGTAVVVVCDIVFS